MRSVQDFPRQSPYDLDISKSPCDLDLNVQLRG
jgi:hypothetical protein